MHTKVSTKAKVFTKGVPDVKRKDVGKDGLGRTQLFITVDALSASTIAVGEVATLRHKIWNHAVENTAFVVQIFTGLSDTFFSDRCQTNGYL